MAEKGRRYLLFAGGLALAAAACGLALLIRSAQALPSEPQPVIWDKERCAECQMAVSERGFAAQLQTKDGRVLDFDDPGCLASYLDKRTPEVHAIFFHHLREERWLASAEARFVRIQPTPMAYGLGALDARVPGALTWDQARALVRDSNARRRE